MNLQLKIRFQYLRGIKDKYELHHGVRIKDDAVIAAVELSSRYISDRFLAGQSH